MADNIIQRIIQLVLDKTSAKKAQDDIAGVADAVEDKWKSVAAKIAEFLGAAFLVEKIKEFGKAAIEVATDADASWRQLEGTINATGASFDGMSEKLKKASEAFEDATIHRDEDYIKSLTRMITLTGDVTASTNNMGLVANVAAAFFKGDLEPAVNLVAKAMNGNVTQLQRLGIHAKDAQDALNILNQRGLNRGTIEAQSFGGQMAQLHNSFIGMLEDLGNAIIKSDGSSTALGTLRAAVKSFDEWINKNKGTISDWVKNGVAFAIDALDVLIRAFESLQLVMYPVYFTLAAITEGMYFFVKAASAVNQIMIASAIMRGQDASGWIANQVAIDKAAESLEKFGNAAKQLEKETLERQGKILTQPLFSSDQFKNPPKPGPLDVPDPMVSKNKADLADKEVEKAIESFKKEELAAKNMQKILGDAFNAVNAEIDRSSKLLNVLAGNGIDPALKGFGDLAGRLHELVTVTKPVQDVMKTLSKTLDADVAQGFASAQTGVEGAATQLDVLEKRQKAVKEAMDELAKTVPQTNAAYIDLREQYQAYTLAISEMKPIQAVIDATKELAKTLDKDLADGIMQGKSSVQILETEIKSVGETMDKLRKEDVDPTSAAFLKFQRQWDDLNVALEEARGIEATATALSHMGQVLREDLAIAALKGANALEKLKIEQHSLEQQIQKLIGSTEPAQIKRLKELEEQYRKVTDAIKEQTIAMQFEATIADLLADILGTAMQGGLHAAAVQKAKQNAIEAAEMVVRAGVFALFGDFPAASAALVAAAQFATLAAAWGALAATGVGGSSGSAASPVPSAGSATTGGNDLTSSRAASSQAASSSSQPSPEVSIYLVGPGFNAVNPEVQRVVWGATQEATERYGAGSRIRIRTTEGA